MNTEIETLDRRMRKAHGRRGDQIDGGKMLDWMKLGEEIPPWDKVVEIFPKTLAYHGLYGDDRPQ